MRDFNKLLQDRIDKKFNIALIATSIIALIGSIILYISDVYIIYSVINFITAIIMFILTIIADKVRTAYKIIIVICVTSIVAVASYIGGGFTSAFIILLAISNVVAVLFLSKRESILVSVLSTLILTGLCIYSVNNNEYKDIIEMLLTWGLQIVAFILFAIVLHVSVHATKKYLMENINGLEDAIKYSEKLAYYDQLTDLPNIHKFEKDVKVRIKNLDSMGYIVFINMKSLRSINSTMGHSFGNQALISAAEILNDLLLDNSFVARTSGNEFALWIEGIEEDKLQELIREMMYEIKIQSFVVKKKFEFFSSYAVFNEFEDDYESCVQKAALALAYAKNENIPVLTAYKDELDVELRRKENLKDHIEFALENNEFTLYYQSKYDSKTGKVIGVEALSRWISRELGTISPKEFIPIIESLNMAKHFGEFVINKACEDYKELKKKYHDDLSISVNISPSHIMQKQIIQTISSNLSEYDVPSEKFIVEITEDITIEDLDLVLPILDSLRDLKVRISLDDFGTGYSSLNYLTKLSLDEIKIDKSFVDQIGDNTGVEYLLESIIRLSKQFNLDIIAEGVETDEQINILKQLKCNKFQGYYFAKPEPLK